jgi:acetyl-CoA C-acetyltransferase
MKQDSVMRRDVVVAEAVRTPQGRRDGGLSAMHSCDLLGVSQLALVERSGIDPGEVDQVIAGVINQSGAQGTNIARTSWLAAGLPMRVPATTVDSQCGSSQQGLGLAASLIGSGVIDVAVACGVESMSQFPVGASRKAGPGDPITPSYRERYEWINQFESAERIAERWGITREECDEFGVQSQARAAQAWAEGRFDAEIVEVDAPVVDESGAVVAGKTRRVLRDEGLRETTLEGLARLKPVGRPDGVHTAGTSSQLADQSSAVLLASAERAEDLGLRARARVVDHCLVGTDPVLMLTGPMDATRKLLDRNGLTVDDIDVFEVNEAFASIVLAWAREVKPDMDRVNPNGGAIAIGHALGSTGTRLVTTAVHELERTDGEWALVTMCCGGGLGTGTLLQRV